MNAVTQIKPVHSTILPHNDVSHIDTGDIEPGDIEVVRVEANLGAEVRGFDFSRPITADKAELLRSLLWEHQVLFFRDTGVDDDKQFEIGRVFGPPVVDSIAKLMGATEKEVSQLDTGPYSRAYYGTPWHADATYLEEPYLVSILRSEIAPEIGGDTAFSSGISAYAYLPEEVKRRIEGLTAIHRPDHKAAELIEDKQVLADYLAKYNGVVHPVVTTHPYSGRKVLYVNEGFTTQILGVPEQEGRELLSYLVRQFYRPEHIARFKWRPGSLAIWDNRAVQHYGVPDYGTAQRRLVRVVAKGDRPQA